MDVEQYRLWASATEYVAGSGERPVRFYLDVDGTILPDNPELPNLSPVELTYIRQVPGVYPWEWAEYSGMYMVDLEVMGLISEISHRDDVDIIWLTGWKSSAPATFDEHFNIRSAGWLDWDVKLSDYNHSFKRVSVHEDQELAPSKFVWADDLATSFYWVHEDEDEFPDMYHAEHVRHRIPKDRYLLLNPDSRVGVTADDLRRVKEWLDV